MKYRSIVACALSLIMSGAAAHAFSGPEPTGFDKVKFGVSIEEVRKAYPSMQVADAKRGEGALHPKIQRFFLPQYQLPGLEKPTDIDLQFWDGKFWLGQIHFGDNDPAKTDAYLKERYGAADYQDENYMTWNGKTAAATLARKRKTFEVHDEGLSNAARAELFKRTPVQSSAEVQATPAAAAGTPGAAPAGAATPASTGGGAAATPAK